jgi:hypothetical protein
MKTSHGQERWFSQLFSLPLVLLPLAAPARPWLCQSASGNSSGGKEVNSEKKRL